MCGPHQICIIIMILNYSNVCGLIETRTFKSAKYTIYQFKNNIFFKCIKSNL